MHMSIQQAGFNSFAAANNLNSIISKKIQFEKLAFFNLLHELMAPTPMIGKLKLLFFFNFFLNLKCTKKFLYLKFLAMNPNHRPYMFNFNFTMNLDQANEITGTREVVNGKTEYSKQIHLR
jgi:hypothetical protein